ncbi:acyl-CoA dehydrogenase [Candidatus Woesearchaeota archaeon]|nr:acyl-CoA dehydrogenase [Candidatus Woesearchaeota archaeon]
MEFGITDEQIDIRNAVREFVKKEILPYADEWDKQETFPYSTVKAMGQLGIFGCCLPEEYCGNNTGFLSQMIITEEIARGSSSLRVLVNTQALGTALTINKHGTKEQKEKYIHKLITAEYLGCFAITEPNVGSDIMSMETTAEEKDDHFLLNGTKTWISQASLADVMLVYAYTDKSAKSKGMSAFLLEPKGLQGVNIEKIDKLGTKLLPTCEVSFSDVKIPKENLLGKLGEGSSIVFSSLCQTRLSAAAGGVGVAQACLDVATQYATKERKQFGKQIGEFQMVQDIIAKMVIEIETAKLMVYKAAWQKDHGKIHNDLEVAEAKYLAGETAVHCADGAMRIFSAYGYSTEYAISRYLRDAYAYPLVEGTSNICKWITAMDHLGYRKANK